MIGSILVIIFCYLLFSLAIRNICSSIVRYLMTKKEYEKAKCGMNFKEWFTFSRFRLEIPNYHIVFYYCINLFYLLILLSVIFAGIMGYHNYLMQITKYIGVFSLLGAFLYTAYFEEGFHSRTTRVEEPYKIILRGIDKKAYLEKKKSLEEKTNNKKN